MNIISGMSVITSGQIAVKCYQMQPVEGKILPRTLRAGLYSLSGELISDEHELVFDLTGSSTHDREMTFSLVLTHEAEKYNGQEIVLKLREYSKSLLKLIIWLVPDKLRNCSIPVQR